MLRRKTPVAKEILVANTPIQTPLTCFRVWCDQIPPYDVLLTEITLHMMPKIHIFVKTVKIVMFP